MSGTDRQLKIAFIVVALMTSFAVACGGRTPDRVVDVVLRCTLPAKTETTYDPPGKVVIPAREVVGGPCLEIMSRPGPNREDQRAALLDLHQDVTIRSSAGGSYIARADWRHAIHVGNAWP